MQEGFIKASPEEEKAKINLKLPLWDNAATNQGAKKTATSMCQCIKANVTSDNEKDWHSHSLADEDEEVQYSTEDLFVPSQSQAQAWTSKEEFKAKMQEL